MKQRLVLFALVLCATIPSAFAFDGDRSSFLIRSSTASELRESAATRSRLTRALQAELARAGFDVNIDDVKRGARRSRIFDYIIEVGISDSARTPLGGVSGGTRIGSVGVATEVSMVRSEVAAEFRLYDGKTEELIDTFELSAEASAPALTGLGVGDPYGFVFINIPWFSRGPSREATRRLAREAVEVIADSSQAARPK